MAFARKRTLNQALLAGNPQVKKEVELVAIFLVLASYRMETLYNICFGPGNGKVKISSMQVVVLFIWEEYLECDIVNSV